MERYEIIVDDLTAGYRLDKFLTLMFPQFSRSRIQALLSQHQLMCNDVLMVDASHKVKVGERYCLILPPAADAAPQPEEISLDVFYEDDDLLVINKPAGMVVHPAPGHSTATLVNALLAHCGDSLSGIGGVKRPGIVHRLDKDTSGLMVVAKNDFTHHGLSEQFATRSLSRTYHAVVWGVPSPSHGTIDTFINRCPKNRQKMAVTSQGKQAITHYHVLETYGKQSLQRNLSYNLSHNLSLVSCVLETGRTHQIRVHMHHIGHPLLGDQTYGHLPKFAKKMWGPEIVAFPRQALHAKKMVFIHPRSQEFLSFEADYPADIKDLLNNFKK